MANTGSHSKRHLFTAALGALGGGLFVALATKAIPKIIPQVMSGMKRKMMEEMGGGCP